MAKTRGRLMMLRKKVQWIICTVCGGRYGSTKAAKKRHQGGPCMERQQGNRAQALITRLHKRGLSHIRGTYGMMRACAIRLRKAPTYVLSHKHIHWGYWGPAWAVHIAEWRQCMDDSVAVFKMRPLISARKRRHLLIAACNDPELQGAVTATFNVGGEAALVTLFTQLCAEVGW